jgi:phage-related protein
MGYGSSSDAEGKASGSSKKDLLAFPGTVVDDFGYALSVVQHGGTPPSAKAWRGKDRESLS